MKKIFFFIENNLFFIKFNLYFSQVLNLNIEYFANYISEVQNFISVL